MFDLLLSAARALIMCALLPWCAFAESVTIHISPRPAESSEHERAELVATGSTGDIRRVVDLRGENTIELEPGVWYLRLVSARWWSPDVAISVRSGASNAADLSIVPAGMISGRFANDAALRSLFVKVWSRADGKSVDETLPCAIEGNTWNCIVPAGIHDLRLRPGGYVSIYRWAFEVPHGGTRDLGMLALRRGSSVVGRVQVLDPKFRGAAGIRLTPRAYGDNDRAVTVLEARADAKGFFHFDGLAAGSYAVTPYAPGLAGHEQVIEVIDGGESELLHPLVLAPPAALDVTIIPPLDPSGIPWTVTLDAPTADRHRWRTVTESRAAADGAWTWRGAPGTYTLSVGPSGGGRWKRVDATLDRDDRVLVVPLPAVAVKGRVLLGDKPVKGTIYLGGRFSAESVAFPSDDDGAFGGHFRQPDDEQKTLQVTVEATGLSRTVDVPVDIRDGVLAVAIDLPQHRLRGAVVTASGEPVQYALVRIMPKDGKERGIYGDVEPGGMFVADGLRPGTYSVSAEADEGESDDVAVDVNAAEHVVQLTVRPSPRVRGQLRSAAGPVRGAEVMVIPNVETHFYPDDTTDENGRFAIPVPAATSEADLLLNAPGFARRMIHVRPEAGFMFDIVLRQAGGTVALNVPAGSLRGSPLFSVVRGNTVVSLPLFAQWGTVAATAEPHVVRLIVPQLEPGEYGICAGSEREVRAARADRSKCAMGMLAPFGELVLESPVAAAR